VPKILEERVKALKGKVKNPYAVATAALQKEGKLKKGSHQLKRKPKGGKK
jgi:hypothetical protein